VVGMESREQVALEEDNWRLEPQRWRQVGKKREEEEG